MKVNSINSSGIYAARAVAMKAKMADSAVIREFKNFMADNNLALNAVLTPTKSGFNYELELSKKQGYNIAPVTDEDLYAVKSYGSTLNEALLDMAKTYRGKEVYLNSDNVEKFSIPKFF